MMPSSVCLPEYAPVASALATGIAAVPGLPMLQRRTDGQSAELYWTVVVLAKVRLLKATRYPTRRVLTNRDVLLD